jgi:hypothetical protein
MGIGVNRLEGVSEMKTASLALWRNRRGGDTQTADVTELQAQLMLLREENASLRVEQARTASMSRALDQARRLQGIGAETDSNAPQELAQALAVRESVVNLCREVEGALTSIRTRLDADDATVAVLADTQIVVELPRRQVEQSGWSIDALRSLTDEAAAWLAVEQVEELQVYLHYLEEFVTDGVLPERFDSLVSHVFGDVIEQRQLVAA